MPRPPLSDSLHLFLTQASGIKRATDLLKVFLRLDGETPANRARLLDGVLSSPGAISLFVDRAWLSESQASGTRWPEVKDAYQQMMLLAKLGFARTSNSLLHILCCH